MIAEILAAKAFFDAISGAFGSAKKAIKEVEEAPETFNKLKGAVTKLWDNDEPKDGTVEAIKQEAVHAADCQANGDNYIPRKRVLKRYGSPSKNLSKWVWETE